MKILSIIPARSGSNGLKGKNIIDLSGKPLIAWSIEASLKTESISKTLVSSDSQEILDISKKYGADTLNRPKELALDTTSSEEVVKHALLELKDCGEEFDYTLLLQPTSPLRDSENIAEAIEIFLKSNATALISVAKIDNKILKAFQDDNEGYIKGISNNKYPFMRRQDLPKTYISNGAIYFVNTESFLKTNSFFTDKTIKYEMSLESSFDIDTMDDLLKIKQYLNSKDKLYDK
ncbi:MAG: acylneuraminate cytidylyltransferase family protein [Helicobacteraceae bacterium]|nr:acylneuraminate cytidylyltransferase family protein [Helicobacteraceae bacterium]